jgi:chromosome segregation ATPase
MRELAERRRRIARLEHDLRGVNEELALATRARQALTAELSELTAQSGATRERLAARMAQLEDELESARATPLQAPGGAGTELSEALAQAERERDRLASELRSREAEQAELERRLAARGEELDATVRQLTSIESTVLALRDAIAEHTSEVDSIRAERAVLVERADALMLHNDGLTRALTERERSENELRIRVGELRAAAARAVLLEREREQTLEDVRRAEASRAWRLGHGVTRLLRRITFRRSRTRGALERVIERLEEPLPDQTEAARSEPQ